MKVLRARSRLAYDASISTLHTIDHIYTMSCTDSTIYSYSKLAQLTARTRVVTVRHGESGEF